MFNGLMAIAVVLATLPNPALTPGAVRLLSKASICGTKWSLDRRHVTPAMKKRVAASYGLPWAEHARVEFDHFVPRNLGGADADLNLFPMCCIENGRIVGPAHQKDVLEVKLQRLVCAGKLSLADARAQIVTDWPAAYRRYVAK